MFRYGPIFYLQSALFHRADLKQEAQPISIGIAGTKGRLSPAAEKFWHCARQPTSAK
jgi:hypothetical protein